jgi:tight adherence protein B
MASLAALGTAALMILTVAAHAQEAFELRLDRAALDVDGTTTLTVSITGEGAPDVVDASSVTVIENGTTITEVDITPIQETTEVVPDTALMILFDVSGSAAGEPIAAARDAAAEFVRQVVPQGVIAGLMPFGPEVQLAVAPTDDVDALVEAIEGLEAGGETSLYDAVVRGAEVLATHQGDRAIVMFTDGADTVSAASLDEAVDAAVTAEAPILNVALITPDQDPEVLDALAARTDGQLLEVDDLGELAAAFEAVAQFLFTNRHVISYRGTALTDELDLVITVEVDGATSTIEAVLINPRQPDPELVELQPVPLREPGVLGTPTALYAAIGAAFAAALIVLIVLLVPRTDPAAARTLRRGLTLTERSGTDPRPSSGLATTAIGQRAIEIASFVPKPAGYDERRQLELDRAGWNLRSSEYVAMQLGTSLAGGALLWALTGRVLVGLIGLASGFLIPAALLKRARRRRQAKFMEQLPNALQVLAGTLKAGYGPLQGISTIVRETTKPMSTEFQRVLTEARLGLPLEDALNSMADRIDDEDFRWVVVSMNIQRRAGGNLAELLENVAATLREREQTRRQIDVLSAEGRLSAWILILLPIVLVLYFLVVNPTYLLTLLTHPFGLMMSGGAVILMVAGAIWMRRMIRIEV